MQEIAHNEKNHSHTGEHSPLIKLDAAAIRGIGQSGLDIRKGESYSGGIVLSGDSTVQVIASLIWGPGASDRQSVMIDGLHAEYKKYPWSSHPAQSGRIV